MAKSGQNYGALSDAQERFCQEYVIDLNSTNAAIRAGYAKAGAHVRAHKLLRSKRVRGRVQELMDKRSTRTEIKADTVLRELLEIARSDLRQLFTQDGKLKDPKDWPDDAAKFVSSIEFNELFEGYGAERVQIGWTKKVRLWDKVRALELLAKHLKLFDNEVKHSGEIKIQESLSQEQVDARINELLAKRKTGV